MNGHWLHKCLNATGEKVQPLPSLGPRLASNMACVSQSGLYRRPHNASVIVHFLKSPSSMDYALALVAGSKRECVAVHYAQTRALTTGVCARAAEAAGDGADAKEKKRVEGQGGCRPCAAV